MLIPTGNAHLRDVAGFLATTQRQSSVALKAHSLDTELIGTALSALYQAATCYRKCHGSGHVLEALCGRVYNLGCAAHLLILSGLYDEALNLTRSIGEVGNLIGLSVVDKDAIREWLSCDDRTRRRRFSPAEVRKALARDGNAFMIADDDWYSRLCEKYTHVNPQTKPNVHNAGRKRGHPELYVKR
jgi:hypothetical protein